MTGRLNKNFKVNVSAGSPTKSQVGTPLMKLGTIHEHGYKAEPDKDFFGSP